MSVSVRAKLFFIHHISGILSDQEWGWHLNVSFFSPLSLETDPNFKRTSFNIFLPYFYLTKPTRTKGIFPLKKYI